MNIVLVFFGRALKSCTPCGEVLQYRAWYTTCLIVLTLKRWVQGQELCISCGEVLQYRAWYTTCLIVLTLKRWVQGQELYTMWRGTAVQCLVHDLPDSPYTEEVGTGARAVRTPCGEVLLYRAWYTTCLIVLTLKRWVQGQEMYTCGEVLQYRAGTRPAR
jgi:hypothetical protein